MQRAEPTLSLSTRIWNALRCKHHKVAADDSVGILESADHGCLLLQIDGGVEVHSREHSWPHIHGRDLFITYEQLKMYEHEHLSKEGKTYRHYHLLEDEHNHPDDSAEGFVGRPSAEYDHEHVPACGEVYRHRHTHRRPHAHEEGELWRGWLIDDYWTQYLHNVQGGVFKGLPAVLYEAYNVPIMWRKVWRVFKLRCAKFVALGVNQKVGHLLLGWDGKENRILDWAGLKSKELFSELYGGTRINQPAVLSFLHRRLLYCVITTLGTAIQILLSVVWPGSGPLVVLVSVLQLPVSALDRQWAALVTKLSPREERTRCIHFREDVAAILRPVCPLPELPRRQQLQPRLMGPAVGLEMLSGFIQFATAVCLIAINASILLHAAAGTSQMGDHIERHVGNAWLVVIAIRCIKEFTNWTSSLLEYFVTPSKYTTNEKLFRTLVRAVVELPEGLGRPADGGKDIALIAHLEETAPAALEELARVAASMLSHPALENRSPTCSLPAIPQTPVRVLDKCSEACHAVCSQDQAQGLLEHPQRDPLLLLPATLQFEYTSQERAVLNSLLRLKRRHETLPLSV